jgi:flavin-dependent thymidylate synthase
MKVTLFNYTPNALETLIFTKNTRLKMSGTGFQDVMGWDQDRKLNELEYMRNTIASSWEFVDYIFMLEDVSRAFTHQLVRHRVGTAFAQQTMRTLDVTGFDHITGPTVQAPAYINGQEYNDMSVEKLAERERAYRRSELYDETMNALNDNYAKLIELGAKPEDARGIVPTNVCTNIVFKANLRTLSEMGLKRLCTKTQGEFEQVFRAMRDEVIAVHPWAENFIRVHCAKWGVCMFPTFPTDKCPIKPMVYDPQQGKSYSGLEPATPDQIQLQWEDTRTPKEGRR